MYPPHIKKRPHIVPLDEGQEQNVAYSQVGAARKRYFKISIRDSQGRGNAGAQANEDRERPVSTPALEEVAQLRASSPLNQDYHYNAYKERPYCAEDTVERHPVVEVCETRKRQRRAKRVVVVCRISARSRSRPALVFRSSALLTSPRYFYQQIQHNLGRQDTNHDGQTDCDGGVRRASLSMTSCKRVLDYSSPFEKFAKVSVLTTRLEDKKKKSKAQERKRS